VHHVAFRVPSNEAQLEYREKLLTRGLNVTPPIDRDYFMAIYFREPGGVLFEVATDPPGFTRDEPLETLGQALKLPAQYETQRAAIEQQLPLLD
jgi:glyoxalase family protein